MSAISNASSRCTRPARQRGAAVLMAILTVALIALISSAIVAEHGAAIEQLGGRSDQAQARWLARAAGDWIRNVLEFDQKRTGNVDHLREEWSIPVSNLPIDEEGVVSGEIIDQSGRFNINTLVVQGVRDATQQAIFERLLEALDVSPKQAESLVDAITDWIDTDSEPLARGAESAWYAGQQQKIMPPNAPIISIKELLSVSGMTPQLLERLRPHIAALPADATRININTASAEVLSAFVSNLSLATARQIVLTRANKYFRSVADFTGQLPASSSYNAAQFDVQSLYFMATGRARWGDATAHMQILLRRNLPRPDIIYETIL
jgi:general secretion pathway protein K